MEPFVSVPIAFLSMIGIVVLAIDTKKNDEENNKSISDIPNVLLKDV